MLGRRRPHKTSGHLTISGQVALRSVHLIISRRLLLSGGHIIDRSFNEILYSHDITN